MKSPPLSGPRILSLCDRWRTDSYVQDLDFAELMRHYNGGALISECDDAGRERVRRANLLFGHKFLSRPIKQLMSTYHNGMGMLEGRMIRSTNPIRRQFVEQVVNREINLVVRESERFKWPYKACCGDSVLWGSGFLYRDDPYDWCPKYGRPLYPWDAPADITLDKFSDWAFPGLLTVRDILSRLDRLEKVAEPDSSWNKRALRDIARRIIERHKKDGAGEWPNFFEDDPITIMQYMEAQPWGEVALTTALPVYWFFGKNFDTDYVTQRPIDLYCVSRYGETSNARLSASGPALSISRGRSSPSHGEILFYQEKLFADVRDCLFPFIVDCMEGGEPLMRRVLGLGAINYDLDIRMQNTVNAGLEGAELDFAPFFQANDDVSDAVLQALQATGIRPYDVFPQGLSFIEKPRGVRPYAALMEFTQLFNTEMGQNSATEYGTGQLGNKGRSELEVQVLERQAQTQQQFSQRMDDWRERGDHLCRTMGETICSPALFECDVGFREQAILMMRLQSYAIDPAEAIGNFIWKMRAAPGHGDLGIALQRSRMTMGVSQMLGPKAQKIAVREFLRNLWGGDMRMADLLVPEAEENTDQQAEAEQQNAVALTQLSPPQVQDSDLPGVHVPVHMKALQNHAMLAAQGGGVWRKREALGFQALAAHTMADINALGAFDPQQAKMASRHLGKIANQAGRFAVLDANPQMEPKEQAKLQLQAAELDRKTKKDEVDLYKWRRTQEHREEQADHQDYFRMEDQRQAAMNNEVGRTSQTIGSAVQLASLSEPPNAETGEE